MEFPRDIEEWQAENAFVRFLITISSLNLSPRVTYMLQAPDVGALRSFLGRNRIHKRPEGILVL